MLEAASELIMNHGKKLGVDALEIFGQKKVLKQVSIQGGKIARITEQEKSGLAFRTIVDNCMSFVATNSSGNLEEALELSIQIAKRSSQTVSNSFVSRRFVTRVSDIRDDRLRDLSLEELSDNIHEMLDSTENSKPLRKLDGKILVETEERLIVNTEGLWKREVGTRINARLVTIIHIDDYLLGSGSLSSRTLSFSWQELFNKAIKTAYSQLNQAPLTTKTKNFIFGPQAVAKLLAFGLVPSFYSTNVDATSIRKRFKPNKNLQLIDDPTFPGAQNTFAFDDEGYPSRPRIILGGGKIRRRLGMQFSCGFGAEPKNRGNCYRVRPMTLDQRSFTNYPTISASNIVVKAKKEHSSDLISEVGDGLYIADIVGAQDSNYFSGDFVVSIVEGYNIKNGEIVNPITPCFCSGNIYRILEDPNLLFGSTLEEAPVVTTSINILTPEILTSRLVLSK